MKSRISFFNFPAFKKDVRRFAPVWVLYSVGLAMIYMILMMENTPYYRANALAGVVTVMVVINAGYGFLNAQLLFGDLFDARLCNALHAMPLRRETWYGTHLVSGLAFSVVPNLVFALVCAATMNLGIGWMAPWYWLLGSTLEYLCFFAVAVFAMMITGNRFAGLVVYGLMNFCSLLVLWLVDTLYQPLLPGIRVSSEPFLWFSPFVQMLSEDEMIQVLGTRIQNSYGQTHWVIQKVVLDRGFAWVAVYAALGAALLIAGLWLYRKRPLECAGDFMAFKSTEPVLLTVYTLAVGTFFYLFSEIFGESLLNYLFLVFGLAIGFFTGTMLLRRTTRVFRGRTFLRFGIFVAVFFLTLLLTWVDPLGISRWVPDADDVASVNLSNRYEHHGYSEHDMDLTDPAAIADILAVHEYQIGRTHADELAEYDGSSLFNICIEYTLKNGATRTRFYEVNVLSEAGQTLKKYLSSFEFVMDFPEEQIPEKAEEIFHIYSEAMRENSDDNVNYVNRFDREALLRAIARDCAEGNLSQIYGYHYTAEKGWDRTTYLEIGFAEDWENSDQTYIYLNIYPECVHTLHWMEANGLYDSDVGK